VAPNCGWRERDVLRFVERRCAGRGKTKIETYAHSEANSKTQSIGHCGDKPGTQTFFHPGDKHR
jgi:hypothetical protein